MCSKSDPRRALLALLVGLSVNMSASAAYALQPLGAFLAHAEAHNEDVREAAAQLAQQRALARQTDARLLPSLSASAGYTRNQNEVIVRIPSGANGQVREATITPHDQLDASATLNIPLLNAGAWAARTTAARNVRLSQLAQGLTWREVQGQLATTYTALIAADATARAAEDALGVARASLQRAEARVAAKTAPALEVARARAEVARQEQLVIEAQQAREDQARTLARLSGLSPEPVTDGALDELERQLPPDPRPRAAWLARADEAPDVLRAQAEVRLREAQHAESQRTTYLPALNGRASERWTNASGFGPSTQWALGVTLSWSLEFGTWHSLDASAAATEAAQIRLSRARTLRRDTIARACDRVTAAQRSLAAARAQERAATEAAAQAKQRYEAGTGTQLDTLQADRDALSAQVNRIAAHANLLAARAAQRTAAGLPPLPATPQGLP